MTERLGTFRDINLEDRELFERFLVPFDKVYSIYNFANLFTWGRLHKYRFTMFGQRLVLYLENNNFAVFPPSDDITPEDLLEISDALTNQERPGHFCFVPPSFVENHPGLEEHFEIEPDENNADYIYSTPKLAELKGRKLHKKKNLLRQFQRNNPDYRVEELAPKHHQACIDLSEVWCMDKTCDIVAYAYETDALRKALEYVKPLDMKGLVLLIRDRVVGFSIFNRQCSDTGLVHFEKFDRVIKGTGQAINQETASFLRDQYQYLNREQDLGIEGLRRAKESYLPEYKALTYRLKRK